jgi:adenine C2-methylase RlmN of 23S rRNA A2503 and tRNA A37
MTSNKTSNPDIAEYKETQSSTVKRLMDYAHKETQIESVKIMLTDFALYDKNLL